ncbi:glycosidase [Salegentibacter sp. 24]|uniref:glycoside hydrolase family 13 protein n=1 Tax=Salegentibacter sp. 24 TaxID=2183986 RepID=UPI00105CD497|nr:glycoside hydrolase family 13 protein [Salegentibacter sp. 24]TDN87623.1 glycosidase [Salegentibacter sp. 24]
MKKILICFFFLAGFSCFAQIERVEPPNWWTGFKDTGLQLMVYGNNIGNATPSIDYPGVSVENVEKADSPNYLFIDLAIGEAQAGTFDITFAMEDGSKQVYEYELKEREKPASAYVGFDNTDAIYLITPDRFANGDKSNDSFDYLNEKTIDRSDAYARHGGDIRGIIDHLDYIEEMGFTAIWPSPLLINDMESGSYHGYAMTDFYKVDPRFGTLKEYKELSDKAADRGIKLIMDQVANHSGVEHWWMDDLPFDNWINFQEKFENGEDLVYSNHRRTTNQDLYASKTDKKGMTEGWFVATMPDLNQENPFLAQYLIQNSIWWIETLGLGGIRQDTYPYPDKAFMSDWAGAIMKEYPNFNIVGEEWSLNPLLIRYWQDGVDNAYDSNLKSTMDFAMQDKIVTGLKAEETWGTGLVEIYEGLANDFAYADPENIMIFPDNHDKSRIYTQLGEDVAKTKMTIAYMAVLPRIFQMYYGTEILMDDSENPGDHGLIRTEFPGGWEDSQVNAFTGKGLSEKKSEMQEFVKKVMNYRKDSQALHAGETKHFAPQDGTYLITRKKGKEVVVLILNKNQEAVTLDLERFSELNLKGKTFKNLISEKSFQWGSSLELPEEGVYFFTTKME